MKLALYKFIIIIIIGTKIWFGDKNFVQYVITKVSQQSDGIDKISAW